MPAAWESDKAWSDQFMPEVKQIIGPLLLETAPLEIDQKQAGDLMVLRGKHSTIAVRIRRPGYLPKYANEFTIRMSRPSGAATEYEKLSNGFGDLFFYGHGDTNENTGGKLARWMLIDLTAWRAHLILSRDKNGPKYRCGDKENPPHKGGEKFRWYDASSFPAAPRLVIQQSHPFEQERQSA
jgi:hypothetical protein